MPEAHSFAKYYSRLIMEQPGIVLHVKSKRQRRLSQHTRETTTSLAEFLTSIANDDVLLEIFTRLPNSRSAIHCAAVCKRWRSVISNPDFVSMFRQRHKRPSQSLPFTLLIRDGCLSQIDELMCLNLFSNESKILHGPERLADSSIGTDSYLNFLPPGGVVRAASKDLLLVQISRHNDMCVCNPLTRKFVRLPTPPPLPLGTAVEEAYIYNNYRYRYCGFSCHGYGFVCDPNSDENYIVMVMKTYMADAIMRVALFRSETGKWDESIRTFAIPPGLRRVPVGIGTSHGVIYTHLVANANPKVLQKIAAFDPFDISTGLGYREFNLPKGFRRGWRGSYLFARICVVRGRLRLYQSYIDNQMGNKFVVKVWQLNKKYEDWNQMHDLKFATGDELMFTRSSTLLMFHPDDDDVFFFETHCKRLHIWEYHIGTESCNKITELNCKGMFDDSHAFTMLHQPWPTELPQHY